MSDFPHKTNGRNCCLSLTVSVVFCIAATGMFLLGHLSCHKTGPSDSHDIYGDERAAGIEVPTVPDQGFVLIFSGNWLGQLEPCGCSDRQLGGIDRRSDVLSSVQPENRLLLDAGPLIHHDDRQSQLKLETFLRSMKQLQYDAISLTGREIGILRENLDLEPNERPVSIASNLPEQVRKEYGLVRYFEKTLVRQDQTLNCLVLAVSDPRSIAKSHLGEQLQSQNPFKSVVRFLLDMGIAPVARHKDKLIILMVSAADATLIEELRKIPAVDLLVTVGYADEAELAEFGTDWKPVVLSTGRLGKYVAGFTLPADSDATLGRAEFFSIPIDAEYPRDRHIVQLIDNYQLQMQAEGLVENEMMLARTATPEGLLFVGNSACNSCHQEIYSKWKQFKHGHALDTLVRKNRNFDPECVSCHTVGMRYVGGYRSQETTPDLAHVGCESCHGPGSGHLDEPFAEYQMIFTSCEDCHNHETSPEFEVKREDYMSHIRHWEEPRRYWK